MTSVDLYLRLSVDREGKDSLERQESDLRKWAKAQDLKVRTVWRDTGKSGYKADVVREEFEAAVKAVSSGEVGTLAVWKLDRLSRRGAGQVGLVLDAVEAVGGRLYFLKDNLDSTVPNARTLIILVSEQARSESANTSLRVRDKIAADAAAGTPKKGVRAFGWERDGITLRPVEAELVRTAVEDYLDGKRSLTKVAQDWTAAGVLTDGMKRKRTGRDGVKRQARQHWTPTVVRQLLLRERNAGFLIHQGERMPKSNIAPIISEDQLDQLKARVKVGTPVGKRAESLLGGIVRCECGEVMHASISYSQRKGGPRNVYRIYGCSQKLFDRTRPHSAINQHIVDSVMSDYLLAALIRGEISAPSNDTSKQLNAVLLLLSDNKAAHSHLTGILLDHTLSSAHGEARAKLKAVDSDRAALEAKRDQLLASEAMPATELASWVEDIKSSTPAITTPDDAVAYAEAMQERLAEAWGKTTTEWKRNAFKALFAPVVKNGGRGEPRVVPNPVSSGHGPA